MCVCVCVVKYDARETPIHETTQEGINSLLADGYEVDGDRLPSPKKNPALQALLIGHNIKRCVNGVA